MADHELYNYTDPGALDGTENVPIKKSGANRISTSLGVAKTILAPNNNWVGYQNFGGSLDMGGALNIVGRGSASYITIVLASNTTDNLYKGATINGAPNFIANPSFTVLACDDIYTIPSTDPNDNARNIYIGGGGWDQPDANFIQFYTSPTYDQTNNQGHLRAYFSSSGEFVIKALGTDPDYTKFPNYSGSIYCNNGRLTWMRGDSSAGDSGLIEVMLGTNSAVLPSNITVTASPFIYQNTTHFNADVITQGGTVSKIEFSRDGISYYDVGQTAGMTRLSPSDRMKVTYSVAPTMTLIPR